MAVYNAERYLEQALNSIINQTYKNLEIIIVNDGSTDNSGRIIEKFLPYGIQVLCQKNQGQNSALNYGYSHSKGTYIKFIDADDIINEKCIELQVEALAKYPDKIAYSEWSRFFNDDLSTAKFVKKPYWKNLDPIDFLTSDIAGPMLQCGIMLVPRHIFDKAGLWDTRLLLSNDTELFTRVLLNSKGTVFTNGAKLYYRSGVNTSLTNQKARKYFESTFLGAKLIGEHLFPVENSVRTRKFIANLLQQRLFEMYPNFPDLERLHKDEIIRLGGSTIVYKSGKGFNFLRKLLGWKVALRIKNIFYKLGYTPTILIKAN